jgi:SAM-dependent methyltransferase
MSSAGSSIGLGQLGISEALREFTSEMPHERRPILDFVMEVAADAQPGITVLDLGAGDAPYRELFDHTRYVTSDWDQSVHVGGRHADVVARAWELPIDAASVDLVLCTQVLEHVPKPQAVLNEIARVLRKGCRVALTVPLVWQLHELPYDYYRYTPASLDYMLAEAGFVEIDTRPRNDCFSTLAQLMLNAASIVGRTSDDSVEQREHIRAALEEIALQLPKLAPLDVDMTLPLGYATVARRA